MKYLLDTNMCIYFLKDKYDIKSKLADAGISNCYISEITFAELLYGAEKSDDIMANRKKIDTFITKVTILTISDSIEVFAKEKARLAKAGTLISDFDILIGTTAIANDMIMATGNVKEFSRLNNIKIEDWTK